MGKHSKPAYELAEADYPVPGASIVPDVQLSGYRAAVDDLVTEGIRKLGLADPPVAGEFVGGGLSRDQFAPVLSRLGGGPHAAARRLAAELHRFRPSARGAGDLWSFARIMLLSQIDSLWWGETRPFSTDADVTRSAELVDLPLLKTAGLLRFQYREQPAGLAGRARDWARRQALPERQPLTAGLRFTRSRPAIVALLNEVAGDLAAAMPPGTPQLWVTSMVRSVEHQHRLRSLGYAAVLPSSHCAGYACDVEMQWFRRFDTDDVLARLLLERQDAGQVNVIDEGQVWHLCVNPRARGQLQAVYDAQLAGR